MIRIGALCLNPFLGIPRESGDDPFQELAGWVQQKYSPRERG